MILRLVQKNFLFEHLNSPASFENYGSKKQVWRKESTGDHSQSVRQAQFENFAISNKILQNTTTYIDEYLFSSPETEKTCDEVLFGSSISTTFARTSFLQKAYWASYNRKCPKNEPFFRHFSHLALRKITHVLIFDYFLTCIMQLVPVQTFWYLPDCNLNAIQ